MNRQVLSGSIDSLPKRGNHCCLRSWQIGRQNVAMRPWKSAVQGYNACIGVVDWVCAR
jgi:hypothetical protein